MPKISFEESNEYVSGSSFFGLADDGDVAQVNFLIDNENDIEVYATHKVEVDRHIQTVNCLREPGAPMDDCPLCKAKHGVSIGVYVKLIQDGKLKIWNRGKTFYDKIKNLARRFKPLSSHVIEIERSGKKGDQNTTYNFYDIETDESIKSKKDLLADFSKDEIDAVEIFGNIIKDYDFNQLENYLDTGVLSDDDDKQIRRRNRKYSNNEKSEERGRKESVKARKPVISDEGENGDEEEEVY